MRLTLRAGIDAVKDYIALHDDNKNTMKILSCERGRCAEAAQRMNVKLIETHEETVSLKRQITVMLEKELKNTIRMQESAYIVYFADSIDEIQARTLINDNVKESEKVIIVLFEKNNDAYRFVAGKNENLTGISLKELAGKMRENLNARGGGSEQMIQGSVTSDSETIKKFFDSL